MMSGASVWSGSWRRVWHDGDGQCMKYNMDSVLDGSRCSIERLVPRLLSVHSPDIIDLHPLGVWLHIACSEAQSRRESVHSRHYPSV